MDAVHTMALACFEALNAADEEAYLACFTPDGGQGGPLAGEGIRGREALGALFRKLQSDLGPLHFTVESYYSRFREVALAWTCDGRVEGRPLTFQGISVMAVVPTGHIQWCQVFWDPSATDPTSSALPALASAWMEALESEDPGVLRAIFSPDATLEGMLSAGSLKGPSVLAMHMTHARRQVGGPKFHLERAFEVRGQLALRWRATTAARDFGGVTLLDSQDGRHVDRVRMFWDPTEGVG